MKILINKIIEEIKEAESKAEKIIQDADIKAKEIIEKAQLETERVKEQARKEALEQGEHLREEEERIAKKEAKDILSRSFKEKEIIQQKSMDKLDKAIERIIKEVTK